MSDTKTGKCIRCGAEMEVKARGRSKKYCSRACTRGTSPLPPMQCANCGRVFQPKPNSRKDTCCCSSVCSNAWQHKRRMAAKPKAACRECGKQFTPRAVTGVYCSKACQVIGHNAKAKAEAAERMSKTRHCEHCGDEYLPTKGHQRYCHPTCKDKAQYARLLASGTCTSCKSSKAAHGFTECQACKDKREANRTQDRAKDWEYYQAQERERIAKRAAKLEAERRIWAVFSEELRQWRADHSPEDSMPWLQEMPLPTMEARQ